ncbi:MAG: penicillin-binding protein [Bdellovibrionaceae bacterium]|nr:penicillin-binding protein [Pseudobdellovibrionaceae bacterium]
MSKKSQLYAKLLKFLFIPIVISFLGFLFFRTNPSEEVVREEKVKSQLEQRVAISNAIGDTIRSNKFLEATDISWNGELVKAKVELSIDPEMQKEAERLLKSYKPDYAAIFVMDALTGRVLAMTSFQKDNPQAENWTLKSNFPAASVFKVVTATAAVDKAGISPQHRINFNGGNYTLYRKNVMTDKVTKWTRVITLKEAFARSINTAFGRLSLENLHPVDINEYATRFMFNQEIPTDFPVEMGIAYVPPEKSFELTEVASGFNKTNRMSPVQGAMIAAAVANHGKMMVPYLVNTLRDEKGQTLYKAEPLDNGHIMTPESASKVRELMEGTVTSGTSRKSFRNLVRNKKFKAIEMGGKTGHLTAENPRGRVDWFVGYAMDDTNRIAIAAVSINKEKWTVKSAELGQSMFKKYFGPIIQERIISSQSN